MESTAARGATSSSSLAVLNKGMKFQKIEIYYSNFKNAFKRRLNYGNKRNKNSNINFLLINTIYNI